VRIDLNSLKTVILISVTKNAAVEENKIAGKDGKKLWKIRQLIYIVSIFYCNKKKLQEIGKNFFTDLIKNFSQFFFSASLGTFRTVYDKIC